MTSQQQIEHKRLVALAEQAVCEFTPTAETRPAKLHAAMRHALKSGGKRLRPVLCLAAAAAVQTSVDARRAAVALECVHTYSLIHDDLPCMDNSDLRRGRPTVHKAYDEATALLAGDALLALAFQLTADHPAEIAKALTRVLADAASSQRLVGGQMEDILGLTEPATAERLNFIHRGKTAAMLAAALEMGAIAAGADARTQGKFAEAGTHLGLAFQIADDLLDIEGDASVLGKPTGADTANGKLTYPGLHGIEAARTEVRRLTEHAVAALESTDTATDFLKALALSLLERRR